MHLPSYIRHELWNQGKPLSEAFEVFFQKHKPTDSQRKIINDGDKWYKKALKATEIIMMENAEDSRINEDFCNLAKKGKLIWLGLQSPEGIHDAPVIIPVKHLSGNIYRKNDDFYSQRKMQDGKKKTIAHYVSVRIIDREAFVKAQQEYANSQGKAPIAIAFKAVQGKVGRPSVKAYLVEAFDALTMEDKINFNSSFRSHCPLIRAWLAQSYPQDSARLGNLADETMRKVLSPLFYEYQKTNHH